MTATRRQAREWAIQMLVAADINPGADPKQLTEDFWSQLATLDDEDGGTGGERPRGRLKRFSEERVWGVLGSLASIDASLERFLSAGGWDMYRLGAVERAVLRMGAWEISNAGIPAGVVINEAVDLVNWFASPKSRSLVNGVLDRYAKGV